MSVEGFLFQLSSVSAIAPLRSGWLPAYTFDLPLGSALSRGCSAFLRKMDSGYSGHLGVSTHRGGGLSSIFYLLSSGAMRQAGPLAERESDVFSESRASSLVKGFENSAPAWLAQAPPCASPVLLCLISAFQHFRFQLFLPLPFSCLFVSFVVPMILSSMILSSSCCFTRHGRAGREMRGMDSGYSGQLGEKRATRGRGQHSVILKNVGVTNLCIIL
jgi:hypothetical protein